MAEQEDHTHKDQESRRDFLNLTAGAFAVVGTAYFLWPFLHALNPARDVLAVASNDVDLSSIVEGQGVTIMWRGKPVFIRHRTAAGIAAAREIELDSLPDPQPDEDRAARPEWLVVIGVCTHLGCVPLGQRAGDQRGEYAGWLCPCHGSHYDTSGRIRRGPAPTNLPVPPYVFIDDTTIRIG